MDQATEQRIRQRAYDLWVSLGKPEGSSLRFWKEAEAQLSLEAIQAERSTTGGHREPCDDADLRR